MREGKIDVDGLTDRLAAHVAGVANDSLTADDTEALRRVFLDNFIVSLWGITRPAASQISAWSRRYAGTGASPVLGSSRRATGSRRRAASRAPRAG